MTIKRKIPIMKKTYEKPTVETVKFQYRDQVVVASGACRWTYDREGDPGAGCENWTVIGKTNEMP